MFLQAQLLTHLVQRTQPPKQGNLPALSSVGHSEPLTSAGTRTTTGFSKVSALPMEWAQPLMSLLIQKEKTSWPITAASKQKGKGLLSDAPPLATPATHILQAKRPPRATDSARGRRDHWLRLPKTPSVLWVLLNAWWVCNVGTNSWRAFWLGCTSHPNASKQLTLCDKTTRKGIR